MIGPAAQSAGDVQLPTGTVTFLFTDVEGSTRLWEQHPETARAGVDRHFALVRDAIASHKGHVFRTQGDGLCAAFATAPDALLAALAAQLALHREPWPGEAIRVRMALHTGAAEVEGGDYVGTCLNRMGRLHAIGHGGQTLLSRTTYDLVRDTLPPRAGLHDQGMHQLRDLPAPEHVFQLVHPELPESFPPLNSAGNRPNNLPVELTSFVGREREMTAVTALLASARLVALTGTGGCGKTRLAQRVAAALLDNLPDGAWFVDLAPLTDERLVPAAALTAMGLRETPGRTALDTLTLYLRGRTALVILDNCEHLIAASAELADALLSACPQLQLLVTSREALGIGGEVAWQVPPMSVPPDNAVAPEALSDYEAVRLFIERCRLTRADFVLTTENAAAVRQICRQLDGIPLAIELAAARVRVLSVQEIAERLDDRFRLLTGGSRTALRRQQTLRALVDWSHDLLSPEEQRLFDRLAVFAGGWTLEAAEEVVADAEEGHGETSSSLRSALVGRGEVLDLLGRLVDKSLVVVESARNGASRYRLLETLRQYAQQRLAAGNDLAAVKRRHVAHYLALAERSEQGLHGPDQAAWLNRLETELDNLRAALGWLREDDAPGASEQRLCLAGVLWYFWDLRARTGEGLEWLSYFLAMPSAAQRTPGRALALFATGFLAATRPPFEESLSIWREIGDRPRLALGLLGVGFVVGLVNGDAAGARPLLEESLTIWRDIGVSWGTAWVLNFQADLVRREGRIDEAGALYQQALASWRAADDRQGRAYAIHGLGDVLRLHGDYAGARALYEESLALCRMVGDRPNEASTLASLGVLALDGGDHAAAEAHFVKSLRIVRETGELADFASGRSAIGRAVPGLASLAARAGRAQRAATLFGAADALRSIRGITRGPVDRPDPWEETILASAGLDPGGLAVDWAEGAAMTLDALLAYAVDEAVG
jgi:predicted ATPase/class 3 adenylate cyclase